MSLDLRPFWCRAVCRALPQCSLMPSKANWLQFYVLVEVGGTQGEFPFHVLGVRSNTESKKNSQSFQKFLMGGDLLIRDAVNFISCVWGEHPSPVLLIYSGLWFPFSVLCGILPIRPKNYHQKLNGDSRNKGKHSSQFFFSCMCGWETMD